MKRLNQESNTPEEFFGYLMKSYLSGIASIVRQGMDLDSIFAFASYLEKMKITRMSLLMLAYKGSNRNEDHYKTLKLQYEDDVKEFRERLLNIEKESANNKEKLND